MVLLAPRDAGFTWRVRDRQAWNQT